MITVPFTFVATVSAICYTGAPPVFVDIEPDDVHDGSGQARGGDHAAHQGDHAGPSLRPDGRHGPDHGKSPNRHGIAVIEDACQAHGAEYKGVRAGSIGLSGCFSFYPGKNLGACGEGGIVVTNDDDHMKTIRMLRDWGQEQRYHHALKGFNYRMDGIQGAILRVKLRHSRTGPRRAGAPCAPLHRAACRIADASGRRWKQPTVATSITSMPSGRTIATVCSTQLQAEGVQTGLHYPIPVHLQKAHADSATRSATFP